MFLQLLDSLFNGISIGAVLLMAALGLAIVFGLMGVIDMAHGELIMLGGYVAYVVQNAARAMGGVWPEIYILLAIPIAFAFTALVGLALERGVIRYLYGRPLETLLATWGVSLMLQQFVRSVNWVLVIALVLFCALFFGGLWVLRQAGRQFPGATAVLLVLSTGTAIATGAWLGQAYKLAVTKPWFGAQNVDVTAPSWLLEGLRLGSFQLPYSRLFIIALTALCLVCLYLFLLRSPWGLRVRAVMQNRSMSACLGIPTERVDAITFALGSGLAGVAGCAVSLLGSIGPNTGQNYIVDTFMVVVIGGVGKLVGSIFGAVAIGIVTYVIGSGLMAPWFAGIAPGVSDFFTFFATTSMAKVMVFFLIVVFLQVRPAGLFPEKGRTAEL